MSRLGWVVGLLVSVSGGFFCTYSGILLWRVRHDLGYPDAESYYDVALGTGGPLFGSAVRAIVYVSWAAVLPYFLLACADSLQGLVPGLQMVTWQWALVVAALLFPALQLRTFHQVSARARARAGARARARVWVRALTLPLMPTPSPTPYAYPYPYPYPYSCLPLPLIVQEYEGSLTIFPHWSVARLQPYPCAAPTLPLTPTIALLQPCP